MVPKQQLTTLPKYDEMVSHQDKLSSNNTRPENNVVHTIGEWPTDLSMAINLESKAGRPT
jgi:hypothetical protein